MPDETETKTFLPLGQYDWPTLPAEDVAERVWRRIRNAVFPTNKTDTPIVPRGDLDIKTKQELNEIAAPPACGPLMDEMTATFSDWLSNEKSGRRLQLVVLPPCDESGVIRAWAKERGLAILPPPPRERLGDHSNFDDLGIGGPDLSGDGVLVIPALEDWFLRSTHGLSAVRALLAALARSDRRCLVGCNSWAWAYLCKAVDADSVLPAGVTFQAFDGRRLQDWFRDLSHDVDDVPARFRLSENGVDVFEGEAEGRQDYFVKLAARSLGVPWIAWRMWRAAIRDLPDPDDAAADMEDAQDDGDTFWIASPETFTLPVGREDTTMLTLQALLLHGTLTEDELASVLPIVGERNTVPSLLQSGLVVRHRDGLMCNPVAYPSIRDSLSDAGFNMDRL